jgi:hypothetical protein
MVDAGDREVGRGEGDKGEGDRGEGGSMSTSVLIWRGGKMRCGGKTIKKMD